jgi:hypothetical protein
VLYAWRLAVLDAVREGSERAAGNATDLTRDEPDYERRNRFVAPIVRAVLSRLVGFRYEGVRGGPSARGRGAAARRLHAARRTSMTSLPTACFILHVG